jgi:hypothetical protein
MNARMRASVSSMHAPSPENAQFKRQIVFRVTPEQWPLLEQAAAKHGSIQAALLAGLRALIPDKPPATPTRAAGEAARTAPEQGRVKPSRPKRQRGANPGKRPRKAQPTPKTEVATPSPEEEVMAREAAAVLGLKPSTVKGYIRAGRINGRYDEGPPWRGWVLTRRELERYRRNR